ncbi:ParB/RepB/Spo0J family partition protein (plasmid) [Streptosporangium sp. CA-135522]|uniref:ParB/RepB/Spo0J family partition protein n=1 Tax=Streptosporangium sp. CA-135522 TaxID=3240072 RepID=UPI003D92125C
MDRLEENPLNVRTDYGITEEYVQTIKDEGAPEVDLIVFPSPNNPGMFRVHDGHRRLRGTRAAGGKELLCRIKPHLANSQEAMLLGQLKTSMHHKKLTDGEAAQALFALDQLGVNAERLQQATGKSRKQVELAIQAGSLSPETRAVMAAAAPHHQLTHEEEALLAAQEQDPDVPPNAREEIVERIKQGQGVIYAVRIVNTNRREAAEMARLIDELQAAGVTVTEEMPEGAVNLWRLEDAGGKTFTPETHANCPGHGAYFPSRTRPSFYCTCPESHGYEPPQKPEEKSKLPTRQVREGNTAWRECGELRLKWWKTKLPTRSDPNQRVLKIVTELLTADPPEPLRDLFGMIDYKPFYDELVGKAPSASTIANASTGRLTWTLMARVIAAMEYWMTQPSYSVYLWRTDDMGRPENRTVAQRWLTICQSLGHQLQPIEQAVREGREYQGDLVGSDADDGLIEVVGPQEQHTSTGDLAASHAPVDDSASTVDGVMYRGENPGSDALDDQESDDRIDTPFDPDETTAPAETEVDPAPLGYPVDLVEGEKHHPDARVDLNDVSLNDSGPSSSP